MKRAPLLFALLISLCAADGHAQESPLAWLTESRRAAGVRPAAPDALLSLTAERWAAVLAGAGMLSHRGTDGSSALDRYRAAGGTDVHVGEILGAGTSLRAVEKGWMRSSEHRALALGASWTHVGWGMRRSGAGEVWVVLFCEKFVRDLALERRPQGLLVSGSLFDGSGRTPLLYSGLDAVQPRSWDPVSGGFLFLVPDDLVAGYLRLGFIASETGAFRLTNAFTLPPGMERPAGSSRSSASAASP